MTDYRAPHPFILALLEWFWDTTNTFHFPWGEMTITPFDFAMLTGLSFTEQPVVIDSSLNTSSAELPQLLGPICASFPKKEKHVKPGVLLEGLWMDDVTEVQRARIILLLMINSFLVPDAGAEARCQLRYLASLRDLDQVQNYDWAGLGYAQLLVSMRKACRQLDSRVKVAIRGPWRVIEVLICPSSFVFLSLNMLSYL